MRKMDSGDKNCLTLHNEPTFLAAAWLQLCLAIIIVTTHLFDAFKIESFTINLLHCSDITQFFQPNRIKNRSRGSKVMFSAKDSEMYIFNVFCFEYSLEILKFCLGNLNMYEKWSRWNLFIEKSIVKNFFFFYPNSQTHSIAFSKQHRLEIKLSL